MSEYMPFEIEEVVYGENEVENIEQCPKSAVETLFESVNNTGRIDLLWMSERSGLTVTQLKEQLEDEMYQTPEIYDMSHSEEAGWVLKSKYLSGDVHRKYEAAKRMNNKYPGRFEKNVKALASLLPEKIPFEEIGISIGAPYIPASFYAEFAKSVFGLATAPNIKYYHRLHKWKVSRPDGSERSVRNMYTYGIEQMDALKILENTLNSVPVKVYDNDYRQGKYVSVINRTETLTVQHKQRMQQEAFLQWLKENPRRRKKIEDSYHELYSGYIPSSYDGSFLTLPDLNPDIELYAHQKNAVLRMLLETDVLLNHDVGAGKTYSLIVAAHEKKRMGLTQKTLITVPNHVLDFFESKHKELYPQDKILVIHPKDFNKKYRSEVLEKIRDQEWDCIYMAFSSFDLIRMSKKYHLNKKYEEIQKVRRERANIKNSWEQNRLDSIMKSLQKQYDKMKKEIPEDDALTFEDLGITTLMVDEAHNYKNITLKGVCSEGIVGLNTNGSKKANEMMEKVQNVRENTGSVVFSTGTPLTNSIADLFVLQQYLQPEELELRKIERFDSWIQMFATYESTFEVDVNSSRFRVMNRLSSFHNLPELMNMFANVCDTYHVKKGFDLPECDGYETVVVQKTPELEEYLEDLVIRTDLCRQNLVPPEEDNVLKIMVDARLAALSWLLIDEKAKIDSTKTKVYAGAQNVFKMWQKFPGTAQIVYCDIGTPKKGYNVYDELKDHLVKMGIPKEEIAFVHDAKTPAKRRKLFEDVNNAKVRVLIGSTAKLGTGVNIQKRLIAIHHLDVPWKPSDIIQREGRMIRHGNENKKVYRVQYITEGTFDAYSWQILENKLRFITQVMDHSLETREVKDINDMVLTYAEIKALAVGNPLLKKRIETSNELERTKMKARQKDKELAKLKSIYDEAPSKIKILLHRINEVKNDKATFDKQREKLTQTERYEFGEDLVEELMSTHSATREKEQLFQDIHGFDVILPSYMKLEAPYVILQAPNSDVRYEISMKDAKAAGVISRLEYRLNHLDDEIEDAAARLKEVRENFNIAKEQYNSVNPYKKEVKILAQKLLDIDIELERCA